MPTFRLSEIAARIGARLEPVVGHAAPLPAAPGAAIAGSRVAERPAADSRAAGGSDSLNPRTADPETADPVISGVSGIREALDGQISFLASRRYQSYAAHTRATALIVGPDFVPTLGNGNGVEANGSETHGAETHGADSAGHGPRFYLRVENAYMGFVQTLRLFGGDRPARPLGVDPTAVVAADAVLGAEVSVGPHVVIEAGARIGDRTVIMPGCFIGAQVTLGDDVTLWPNVTIREGVRVGNRVIIHPGAVLGSDGFGFAQEGGTHHKIPQLGTVVIEDDVEIGANSTVDRATTGVTLVGRGVKIDNLVQVGHNVVIGPHALVCAQVGISGSTEIGQHVVLAGQAGLVGHITVGDGAVVGAQAGVTKNVPANTRVSGYPAMEHETALRVEAHTRRLPELSRELKELRGRLARLEREIEKERERVL